MVEREIIKWYTVVQQISIVFTWIYFDGKNIIEAFSALLHSLHLTLTCECRM